ncbi:MAG: hypothetical protein F2520_01590 [Actinobacteria bacterium]|uniref:Unannotated protein n=1 Tax=freshwater metagenome TaxID=449393 RepID=A0A6J5YG83_9ZZZZ|nr:hypothetical protein [Actinomycetota bacterium]MTA76935.1 hypothetical protein [Actinomycetota bacterium]
MTLAFRFTDPATTTLGTESGVADRTGLSWALVRSSTSVAEPTAEVGGKGRRSAIAHLRHDLLIGLGAFSVLAGVLAFSIFGQPRGVAAASSVGFAAPGGSLAAASVSVPAPVAAAAISVESPSVEAIAAANAYVAAVVEQQTLDARNAFLDGVAQQAADQAAAQQAAERAAAPAVVVGANTGRAAPAAADGSVWDRLAQCESGGNWAINTGNGFTGGLQFVRSTWLGVGGGEYAPDAYLATREQQIDIATRVLASQGWGAWPGCTSMMGLR